MRTGSTMRRVDPSYVDLLQRIKQSFSAKGIPLSDAKASRIIAMRMRDNPIGIDFKKGKRKKKGVIRLTYEELE